MAFFPLNKKYGASDIGPARNSPGRVNNVKLSRGPDGAKGGSIKFRGKASSYIEFPNTKSRLDPQNSITILAFINPDGNPGPIFNYNPKGFGVHLWMVRKRVLFARFVKRSNQFTKPLAAGGIRTGTWSFVAATYDQATGIARLFVNSRLVAKRTIGRITLATNFPARMGARIGDNRFYRGKITCLQIYSVALKADQIRAARRLCFKPGQSGTHCWCSPVHHL